MSSRIPLLGQGHVRVLNYLADLHFSPEGLPPYGATVNGVIEAGYGSKGANIHLKLNRLLDAGLVKVVEGHVAGAPRNLKLTTRRAFIVTRAGHRYLAMCRELWPDAFASHTSGASEVSR